MTETKTCNRCNLEKPITDFHKNRAKCKICYYELSKERLNKEPENTYKTCKVCEESKNIKVFMKGRNTCRECHNAKMRQKNKEKSKDNTNIVALDNDKEITCTKCNITKKQTDFYKRRTQCKQCMNEKRRSNYNNLKEEAKDSVEKKKCTKCNKSDVIGNFVVNTNYCKSCYNNIKKEKILKLEQEEKKIKFKVCKDCDVKQPRENFRTGEYVCYNCSKIKLYKWRKENPDKMKEINNKQRSKPEYKVMQNLYKRHHYHSNDIERITRNYRSVLRNFIFKGSKTSRNTVFGCSRHKFLHWIEFNKTSEMTLDNYGTLWNLDHIKPCSSFDLTDKVELKKCFHWSNTVPVLVSENLTKHSKVIDDNSTLLYHNKALLFDRIYEKDLIYKYSGLSDTCKWDDDHRIKTKELLSLYDLDMIKSYITKEITV